MNQCIFCGSTENLNTQFTVTVDDKKVTIDICDEHADEATPKSAKSAYLKRQEEIQKVIEQAKALGLDIKENPAGMTIIEHNEQTSQVPQKKVQSQPIPAKNVNQTNPQDDPDTIPTEKLDSHRGMRSVGGSTSFGNVESYSSMDPNILTDKLPQDVRKGKVKMAVVEGRGHQPLIVPQIRRDGTGTTQISIRQSETDRTLQERFKNMAERSLNEFSGTSAADMLRDCPLCRGDGFIKDDVCPKCHGSGAISIY